MDIITVASGAVYVQQDSVLGDTKVLTGRKDTEEGREERRGQGENLRSVSPLPPWLHHPETASVWLRSKGQAQSSTKAASSSSLAAVEQSGGQKLPGRGP